MSVGFVSADDERHVAEVLLPYLDDPEKLAQFKGFYDIENELTQRGVDRGTALTVLKKFKFAGAYPDVIAKIEAGRTGGSPVEFLNLDVDVDSEL